jgi:Ca2+/Na+ antiporter
MAQPKEMDDDNNESLFSKKSFYFLVPPKQSILELVLTILMCVLYGFFATYLTHPATAEETYPFDEDQRDLCVILSLVVIIFSSYSLISAPIPELTPYLTDDSFHFLFSHHLQRV